MVVLEVVQQPSLLLRCNLYIVLLLAIQQDYRPGLVKLLSKYCYTPRKAAETDISCTGGPFIDLGLLTVGNQISILLKVTNSTGDVIGTVILYTTTYLINIVYHMYVCMYVCKYVSYFSIMCM